METQQVNKYAELIDKFKFYNKLKRIAKRKLKENNLNETTKYATFYEMHIIKSLATTFLEKANEIKFETELTENQ